MRFTIERLRTLVLTAGVLLVLALVAFLAVGKWKNPFNRRDIPKRLGIDIQQEANGVTYTQAHGGHTLFKIHASKVVELKKGTATLHDVKIELYGQDGSRVDRIEGNEFEYNQKEGTATAAGPVEITLMRPGAALAIAPKAKPAEVVNGKAIAKPLADVAANAASGEIHVKTSGLTFDQKSGVATTSQHVDFSMTQGKGSSMGATYDSQKGSLVLDQAVELTTVRGGDTVQLRAQHAEFERDSRICLLHVATADYRGGQATAGEAKILFREDGSAVRLDATSGFALATATGGHLAAPSGALDFDEHNQPRHGHLEGGVKMDSVSAGRQVHGAAPTAELEFTPQGELRHSHLERGVEIHSEEVSQSAGGAKAVPVRLNRTWHSQVADVDFRNAGHGQVEPATMHGTGGVVVTALSQRGKEPPVPSRLTANEVTGIFGPDSVLTSMTGMGNASMEETTATGTRQLSSGDRLEAHFVPPGPAGAKAARGEGAAQLQSAVLEGHVVLIQQPAAKPGAKAEAPMRATAGRAVYEGAGEWLHLTLNPRVDDGGLQLAADKIDISQDSGDAFAHGNVKATWIDTGSNQPGQHAVGAAGQSGVALGGQGPAHVIANEAQLRRSTGEATFHGHARLWQQANSVSGPVIVLDRLKQTLVARSTDPAEPVRAVLLSTDRPAPGKDAGRNANGKTAPPSVIRMRGGDLKYSDAQHKAVMRGGALGTVVAETGTATSVSNEVELTLLPPGNHAGKDGAAGQVDRMTARGRVTLTSEGRRGTGEQLVYTGANEEYVLTGTGAAPPRMTDPARGSVTGAALIFRSRDDSVSIEGGGRKTVTDTTAPK
ncbi:MAG: LptA/OstA family protein [Terracidiphilus sp.]|nr:LptA/OstA family protein [Terracidiphilus sp.]